MGLQTAHTMTGAPDQASHHLEGDSSHQLQPPPSRCGVRVIGRQVTVYVRDPLPWPSKGDYLSDLSLRQATADDQYGKEDPEAPKKLLANRDGRDNPKNAGAFHHQN